MEHVIIRSRSSLDGHSKELAEMKEIITDPSIDPGEDFYLHVNTPWLRDNPPPEARISFWSRSNEAQRDIEGQINDIWDDWLSPDADLTKDQTKVIDFYHSLLYAYESVNLRNSQETFYSVLGQIRASDRQQLPALIGSLYRLGVPTFLKYEVTQSYRNQPVGHLAIARSSSSKAYRHLPMSWSYDAGSPWSSFSVGHGSAAELAGLRGYSDDLEKVQSIYYALGATIKLEGKQISPRQTSPVTLNYLEEVLPAFDWESYFTSLKLETGIPEKLSADYQSLKSVAELLQTTPMTTLVKYLSLCLADAYSPLALYRRRNRYTEERCRRMAEDSFADVLNQEYVRRHLPEATLRK